MDGHAFLVNLALVLGVAGIAAAICRAIRQPPLLGYLLAGVVVGPNTPVPLFADVQMVHALSELGVILLMFSIGLELSARKVARLARTAGTAAIVEISLCGLVGFLTGQLLGWGRLESVFAGAMIAISSTMVIVKTFADGGVKGRFTELVLGILVFEDLTAIVLITVLTAVATGQGVSASELLAVVGKLGAFIAGVGIIGVIVLPRLVRAVARLGSEETTLIFSIGICFGLAVLASTAGFSVALGAFVAGALVAESGEGEAIESMVGPLQNVFSAIFFVSVGMLIEPGRLVEEPVAILVFSVVVMTAKLIGVTIGSILGGNELRRSVRAAMTLSQVGEFSFIIVGVGITHGAVGPSLMAIAVAVSVITAFFTPYLVRASNRIALTIDHRMPKGLATLITLYGSWFDQLQSRPSGKSLRPTVRRLLIDAAFIAALVLGASAARRWVIGWLGSQLGWSVVTSLVALLAVTALLALPFAVGITRNAVALARELTEWVLPSEEGLDRANAPRRALGTILRTTIVAVTVLPLAALLQTVLPSWAVVPGLIVLAVVLVWVLVRESRNLHGHVRAGAEVFLEALSRQLPEGEDHDDAVEQARMLLPGLGQVELLTIEEEAWCVGRTLGEVDLHAWTGASIVAIQRDGEGIASPSGQTVVRQGDVLVVLGRSAVARAARKRLQTGEDVISDRQHGEPTEPGQSQAGTTGDGQSGTATS